MNVQVANVTESPAPAANRAGGSSFYLAMRILRREQREAMFEIYSFCRAVDDIADSDAPHAQRLEGLLVWRKNIDSLYSGSIPPELGGLARAIAHYALRKDDFLAVIDGVEMDARADIRAPSFNELDLYCDRVASAVGRLSVRIFGMDDADGVALAFHLGRALQLTNILRDIDEDAAIGRLYLPQEPLRKAGITSRLRSTSTARRSGHAAPGAASGARTSCSTPCSITPTASPVTARFTHLVAGRALSRDEIAELSALIERLDRTPRPAKEPGRRRKD